MATNPTPESQAEASPVAWFVMLEAARQKRDRDAEARARRELARLGVTAIDSR